MTISCRFPTQEPFAVNGTVQIRVNVTGSTPCLVLHASGMNVTHVALEHPHTHGERFSAD